MEANRQNKHLMLVLQLYRNIKDIDPHSVTYRCTKHMAFVRGRGFFSCFYCGSRSTHKKDSSVRQWKCEQCLAINYLDKNGEITDPPVATFDEAPKTVLYAKPIHESTPPSLNSDGNIFCETCLRNQHLYTSSLAQYLPDDPEHPAYTQRASQLDAYKQALEERYPQICEKCLPRVQKRLRESLRSAQSDHLRRMLDQTRKGSVSLTWEMRLRSFGAKAWWLGFLGQLASDLISLISGSKMISSGFELPPLFEYTNFDLATWSLVISLLALWWHPEPKVGGRGSRGQPTDYRDWYWFQAFWIGLRLVQRIGFIDNERQVVNTNATIRKGLHVFMLGFSLLTAYFGHKSIKARPSLIFNYDPQSLSRYVRSDSERNSVAGGVAYQSQPLNSLASEPVSMSSSLSLIDEQLRPRSADIPQNRKLLHLPNDYGSRSPPANSISLDSSSQDIQNHPDEMDWTPTHSNPRAFKPATPIKSGTGTHIFNQSPPTEESSTFWYKVPPAPISPAQRLRNPPNQPRLISPSPETKESFFNRLTGKQPELSTDQAVNDSQHMKYAFAQPKFFPPEPADITSSLSESLQTFSLRSLDTPANKLDHQGTGSGHSLQAVHYGPGEEPLRETPRHFWLALALMLLLIIWNHTLSYITLYTPNLPATVIGLCTVISLRSLMDHATEIMTNKQDIGNIVGAALGAVQVATTGYVLRDLLVPRAGFEYTQWKPYGSLLIGVMMAHEACLALLQQFAQRNTNGA